MRKTILIVTCLFLLAGSGASQRKRSSRKPKPKTDILTGGLVPIPADEMLYTAEERIEILGHSGWHLASRGSKKADGTQREAYYDRSRIERLPNGFIRTWLKYVTNKDSVQQTYSMALEEYDCKSSRERTLSVTVYNADNSLTDTDSSASKWKYIIPDTVGESVYNVLCRNRADEEQINMELAGRWFGEGRRAEKQNKIESAFDWYKDALALAPSNSKLLEAYYRVKYKMPK
jgi:hypothetical protein